MADATTKLLGETFTEEALRRVCRKAGVLSISRKEDLSLNERIRSVALAMLQNICKKIVVYFDYKRVLTLDVDILTRSLEALSVKMPRYSSDPSEFGSCKVYKKHGS